MEKVDEKVAFEIRHTKAPNVVHYTDRKTSLCCGIGVTYHTKGDVLVFSGLHSKGEMTGVGLAMSASEIDRLIDELTKMREDVIIANL